MRLLVIEINVRLPKPLEHAGLVGSSDKSVSGNHYKVLSTRVPVAQRRLIKPWTLEWCTNPKEQDMLIPC